MDGARVCARPWHHVAAQQPWPHSPAILPTLGATRASSGRSTAHADAAAFTVASGGGDESRLPQHVAGDARRWGVRPCADAAFNGGGCAAFSGPERALLGGARLLCRLFDVRLPLPPSPAPGEGALHVALACSFRRWEAGEEGAEVASVLPPPSPQQQQQQCHDHHLATVLWVSSGSSTSQPPEPVLLLPLLSSTGQHPPTHRPDLSLLTADLGVQTWDCSAGLRHACVPSGGQPGGGDADPGGGAPEWNVAMMAVAPPAGFAGGVVVGVGVAAVALPSGGGGGGAPSCQAASDAGLAAGGKPPVAAEAAEAVEAEAGSGDVCWLLGHLEAVLVPSLHAEGEAGSATAQASGRQEEQRVLDVSISNVWLSGESCAEERPQAGAARPRGGGEAGELGPGEGGEREGGDEEEEEQAVVVVCDVQWQRDDTEPIACFHVWARALPESAVRSSAEARRAGPRCVWRACLGGAGGGGSGAEASSDAAVAVAARQAPARDMRRLFAAEAEQGAFGTWPRDLGPAAGGEAEQAGGGWVWLGQAFGACAYHSRVRVRRPVDGGQAAVQWRVVPSRSGLALSGRFEELGIASGGLPDMLPTVTLIVPCV